MKKLTAILAVLLLSCAGCETLTRFQANPTVQFVEMQALKIAQSFFANGGETDAAWGIANGLNIIGDITTFARQQRAAKTVEEANALAAAKLKAQVKAFAGDPTAVNGIANGVADIMTTANPTTPEQRAKITLAVAAVIQKVAASETP